MNFSRRLAAQCRDALGRVPAAQWLVERPALWRWRRRAVARGAALGVACALLVPLGQIPISAVSAAAIRANVPVAVTSTFITNPITTLPIYYGAHNIGKWILGAGDNPPAQLTWDQLLQAGSSIAVGALALAVVGALASYSLVNVMWIGWVLKRRATLFAAASLRRRRG